MPELVTDDLLWPFLTQMSACLCEELERAGGPELCFCGVLPGNVVDQSLAGYDNCSGGMAWVSLTNAYPSTEFPNPDLRANCSTLIAGEITVGVLRPVPVPRGRNVPTIGQLSITAQQQLSDFRAMHRAITCCVQTSNLDFVYQLGEYIPEGPEGGVVGGTWSIIVQQEF